jgi:opacity protein-like surface antigen
LNRNMAVTAALCVLVGSSAWAQDPRIEIGGRVGWTFSDGVSGDRVEGGDGNLYNRIDPKDSLSYGANVGFYVTPNVELGFLWDRQESKLEVNGTQTIEVADLTISNYHGYVAYNIGDSDAAVRPYVLGGVGATSYGDLSFAALDQQRLIKGQSKFSTTWGAGVKLFPGRSLGLNLGARWTPTYVKSDATGWWCDPWYGCYVVGKAQYSNQFDFSGGITLRF